MGQCVPSCSAHSPHSRAWAGVPASSEGVPGSERAAFPVGLVFRVVWARFRSIPLTLTNHHSPFAGPGTGRPVTRPEKKSLGSPASAKSDPGEYDVYFDVFEADPESPILEPH